MANEPDILIVKFSCIRNYYRTLFTSTSNDV
jgi:hypothetical protein